MLLGNESISTYTRTNVSIWMVLAFQAGLLNVGGLLACHGFVSHVTGYATLFGVELFRRNFVAASEILMVPLFFMVGAMMSGFLIDVRLKMQRRPGYYIVFSVLFMLLMLIVIGGFNGYFGRFGEPLESHHGYALLALLCLVCGLQNGLVTLVSRSVVRTTHLTGITTDLGIGLARVMSRARLRGGVDEDRYANLMRLGIILFFGFGSAVGAAIFTQFEFRGFIFPAVISGALFFSAFYLQVLRSK